MINKMKSLISVATLALLTACGGGGSGESVNTAEGLWFSNFSDGEVFSRLLILPNGLTFGVTILTVADIGQRKSIQTVLVGENLGSGNNLNSKLSIWRDRDRDLDEVQFTGNVTQKETLSFPGPNNDLIVYTYNSSYDNDLQLSDFVGSYIGRIRFINDSTMERGEFGFSATDSGNAIDSSGEFTRTFANGCILSGKISKNTSNKKGFLDLTAETTGCSDARGNNVFSGVAILSGENSEFLALLAFNSSKTSGFVLSGRKPLNIS